MKEVILIGDSIRMGYQDTVREQLADHATLLSSEENGGNSERVLARLDEWAISVGADVVHINCGLHDLRKEFDSDIGAVPLEQYKQNVRSILTRLQAETRSTVIWAMTTPVNEAWHHAKKGFDRFEADVTAYNEAASEVCQELGVPVHDLFTVIEEAGRDDLLLPDGVHFKPEGYTLLGTRVAACVKAAF